MLVRMPLMNPIARLVIITYSLMTYFEVLCRFAMSLCRYISFGPKYHVMTLLLCGNIQDSCEIHIFHLMSVLACDMIDRKSLAGKGDPTGSPFLLAD